MATKRQHTAEILDISEFLAAGQLPERPLKRSEREVWKTRVEPIDFTKPDGPHAWALNRGGDLVRIPLLPYRSANDWPEAMLGVMDVIQRCVETVPTAIRTHIILGRPIENLAEEDALRFWVGFSAKLH